MSNIRGQIIHEEEWRSQASVDHPEGAELCSSLRLEFKTTNNEDDYKAVLTGLSLAQRMGAKFLEVQSDYLVIVGHIQGEFEARGKKNEAVLSKSAKYAHKKNQNKKILHYKSPKQENERVDQLAQMGSTTKDDRKDTDKPLQTLFKLVVNEEASVITTTDGPKWTKVLVQYLGKGTLPPKKKKEGSLAQDESCSIYYDKWHPL